MIKTIAGVLLALSLGACASNPNKTNYESYLKAVQQIETNKTVSAEAARLSKNAEYGSLISNCTSDACVSNVAAFKSLSDVVDSLSSQLAGSRSSVAAPQREPSMSEKLLGWAQILVPGITSYAGIVESNKTQRHMSDNQTQQHQSQNAMWAEIFNGVNSTPSLWVGGNYGDTAGNNLVSGDNNLIGDRNNNSGRQDAPGPWDYSGNCRDGSTNCPVTNPEPNP